MINMIIKHAVAYYLAKLVLEGALLNRDHRCAEKSIPAIKCTLLVVGFSGVFFG